LEEVAYLVDYSRWLAIDEIVSSAVVTHSDATTPNLVISADELLDDNKVLFKISDGKEGSRYEIRIEATTSTGQIKIDTFRLIVGSRSSDVAFDSIWNELSIGTVETGAPGSPADAEITGESPNQVLNLTIPAGDDGQTGPSAWSAVSAWASGQSYSNVAPASVVTYGGETYVCSTPHTSSVSFDATKFTKISSKGDASSVPGPAAWSSVAAWGSGNNYTSAPPASVVTYGGETYVCHTSHLSDGAFDGTKFTKIASKGVDGLGAGDMIGANNLSDVANATTARENIGANSASNLTTGTLPNARLAAGAAVSNLGYTPVNKAGDTISGDLSVTGRNGTLGSFSSITTTGNSVFGDLGVTYDKVDTTLASRPVGANNIYGRFASLTANNSTGVTAGNQNALGYAVYIPNGGDVASPADFFCGANGYAWTDSNVGGTSGVKKGILFGHATAAIMGPNATHWKGAIACELDVNVLTGASPESKVGLQLSQAVTDQVRGSIVDSAILITNQGGGTSRTTWRNGIEFSNQAGLYPLGSDSKGIVFKAGSVGTILDVSAATVVDYLIRGPSDNLTVSGTGNLTVNNTNPTITLKKTANNGAFLIGSVGNTNRWNVVLGTNTPESGGNTGSDLAIIRYNDGGAVVDAPLTIRRSTGDVEITNNCLLGSGKYLNYGASSGSSGYGLRDNSGKIEVKHSGGSWVPLQTKANIQFVIDGGGSEITTGVKGYLEIPFACTITKATLLADQSGSIVVDIYKDSYANFPPIVGDKITASAPPTISSATKSQDSTLTGWNKSIGAGDILGFNVNSVTTITRVTISLEVTKS
jgi:hypothetical protein